VLDIIPPNDDELPPGIYRNGIKHREPRLARACGAAQALLGNTPYHPSDRPNQHQDEHESQ
jgi:hypothetical protein